MILRLVRLHNFRNYAAQEIGLPPGLVTLHGENGQGKTNLLEALCVLATTKSPLVERDRELIRWGQAEARIAAEVELSAGRGDSRTLEYSWRMEGATTVRSLRAGGVPQSAIAQWLGQLQVVAFFPHDLSLITGQPAERRRFLNLELGKTRPVHFADAARYRRALQQRNALLKHLAFSRAGRTRNPPPGQAAEGLGTLSEWNRQVITYGARILEQRAQFFAEIAPLLHSVHQRLSGQEAPFSMVYHPGVKHLKEAGAAPHWGQLLAASLEADHHEDLRRATTGSGPHRDDAVFQLGEIDLRRFGSQGQQRLAVLALKVALAHWVQAATGEPPVLLLDDALSELDGERRRRLLDEGRNFAQTVLTTTDQRFVTGVETTSLRVHGGRVEG